MSDPGSGSHYPERPKLDATGAAQALFKANRTCSFARDCGGAFLVEQVRLTSMCPKRAGIVRWRRCVIPYGDSGEVRESHVGLIDNHHGQAAIGHALATR
jgi:hypothetical protein